MKFYITGLYHTPEFNDRTLPPIEVEANNRLEALTRTGCTVWTEDEWVKGPHIFGVSDNEIRTVHRFGVAGESMNAPCGVHTWSASANDSEVTCVACRELLK